MKRKVIKQGNNTLTITLPKKWTESLGVNGGDELELEESGKSLIVHTEKTSSKGEIEVDIPKQQYTSRLIIMPYIQGYDSIRIRFPDREVYNKIENFSNYLLGFEIVEQKQNSCVLKNIAKGMDEEFDTILNRLFLVAMSTGHELIEALKKNDNSFLKEVDNIERNATKLDMFCRRMINTNNYRGKRPATSIYRINCIMEEITDIYRDIARFVLENNVKAGKDVLDFMKETLDYVDRFYKLYNKSSQKEIREFRIEEKALSKKGIDMMKGKKTHDAVLMHYALSIIEKLHHGSEEMG
ncbi:AbrB/MazE/SpoVT family DNA-binding domain-containing protein [candidate division KSB1 bacterium]